MNLQMLEQTFSICKLRDINGVDFSGSNFFLAVTEDEFSLVCEADAVPRDAVLVETSWRAFRIDGTLDFGLTGIIAGLTTILSSGGVGVFVVSTYDTDYIFVRENNLERTAELLKQGGHTIL